MSVEELFGHVVPPGSGRNGAHPPLWKAYAYNIMEQVLNAWDDDGKSGGVPLAGLRTHDVTEADIRRVASNRHDLRYERQKVVGDISRIRDATLGSVP